MIGKIKRLFYFPVAYYFRFFAQIKLARWNPKIIVITGSSGKTTLLHLIESQLGKKAKYSHRANSSYGIPFDILGLTRKKLTPDEWIFLFFLAPFKTFQSASKEKFYVVEADCDRPGEGRFLTSFLKPEITLWTNAGLTHSLNFDKLVKAKKFPSVEEAIAHEFGYFLKYTKKLAIVNGDNLLIQNQLKRTKVPIEIVAEKDLESYKINENSTEFIIEHKKYSINFIVPKDVFYSIQMTNILMQTLGLPFDAAFKKFTLPPGRNSILKGIKNTTIIDSTYNATPDGVRIILEMFNKYPSKNKWVVLGDMIELGFKEKEEHEKLADLLNPMTLSKIILIGPRVSKYTYPKILKQVQAFGSEASIAQVFDSEAIGREPQAESVAQTRGARRDGAVIFKMPKEGQDYILKNINGGEVILFKGARFLEGIIEHLLQNKSDADKLVRREKAWQDRRKAWGLA